MSPSLEGRRALVCGASRGIGRAAALALAEAGAEILALARDGAALAEVCAGIEARGGRARPVVADLDDRAGLAKAVAATLAAGPIHVLVHNTGGPKGGALLLADEDALTGAFARHVLSAHLLVRLLLPGMREAGFGRVVTVLSTSVREPIEQLGASNLVRAAMASWAKTLSRELPPGVTINNVLPGYTDTERLAELRAGAAARQGVEEDVVLRQWVAQIPEGRLAAPAEIAAAIAFLASPAAAYVRGVSLAVDGGRLRGI